MTGWLARQGFDLPRLGFAYRTALASCLALVLAWAIGLEHPQWSAMTVWAASQPMRGQLLEKSFFRFAGTVSGTVFGVLLVLASGIHPAILVVGLALWVGACTWIGNLQRGFVSYGTVLAGYSASMVALLDTAQPGGVFELGADRLATVLTGVIVATLVGYYFARRPDAADLHASVRTLLADLLRYLAGAAASGTAAPGVPAIARGGERELLSRIAAVDEGLDPHAAGSIRSRREIRATRVLLLASVPLLLWREGEGEGDPVADAATAQRLSDAADALERGDLRSACALLTRPETADSTATATRLPLLLHELGTALRDWHPDRTPDLASGSTPAPTLASASASASASAVAAATAPMPVAAQAMTGKPSLPVILHRDWIGAREAGLRAGGAMLLFGILWLLTGFEAGAYMLLGLSVMISLFSTFENPAHTMRHVFAGQVLGVIGAIACRWLLWPLAGNEPQQILMLFPFILLGPWLVAHARTMTGAIDYNMALLLLSQPHYPLAGDFHGSVAMGLAVLAGPLAALLAYQHVYPVSLQRRQQHLVAMMLKDVADIARSPTALTHRQIWQARFYHRSLRLVRISERLARAEDRALAASLAFLNLGRAAMRCHELLRSSETTSAARRAVDAILSRLAGVAARPQRAIAALERLAPRLREEDSRLMRRAAESLMTIGPAGQQAVRNPANKSPQSG